MDLSVQEKLHLREICFTDGQVEVTSVVL